MRIISVNAWGGALFDELRAWLPASGVDVLCLQEVTRTPGASGWTRFDDDERSLPQRANLFEDVLAVLPEHQGLFVASDVGPVHDAAGQQWLQEFGLGTFVSRRMSVVQTGKSFVHGRFVRHLTWPADRPRAVQAVRVVEDGRAPVTVVQLHGLRDPLGKGDTPARHAQAERLVDFVTGFRREDELTVVCGDLNLLPESATFEVLRGIGLADLVGTADTRTPHYPKAVRHASYLLVSDPSAVARFEILPVEVSDHRVLQLDL